MRWATALEHAHREHIGTPGRKARRNGAEVGRCAALGSRSTKAGPSSLCAASCRRRSRSGCRRGGNQTGTEQADFTDTRVRQQRLGERAARPAAAGQLRVERREAAGHGHVGMAGELVAEPERGVQGFGPCRRRVPGARRTGLVFDIKQLIICFWQPVCNDA